MSIQDRKHRAIQNILNNETYTPHSGVYQLLEKALGKLSVSDLNSLDLIVSIKCNDARNLGPKIISGVEETEGYKMLSDRDKAIYNNFRVASEG